MTDSETTYDQTRTSGYIMRPVRDGDRGGAACSVSITSAVLKAAMMRSWIGEEQLASVGCQSGCSTSLDEVTRLVDRTAPERPLDGISLAAKGELGWPP